MNSSETYAGSTHDQRIAEATPNPLPAESRLLKDLGFRASTLDQVEIIMPTRKPRGRALPRAPERPISPDEPPLAQAWLSSNLLTVTAALPTLLSGSPMDVACVRVRGILALASCMTSVPARASARYNTERTRPPSTRMVVPVI
jgi:hypothetical protein